MRMENLTYRYWLFMGLNAVIFFPLVPTLIATMGKINLAVAFLSLFFALNLTFKAWFEQLNFRSFGPVLLFMVDYLILAFYNRPLAGAIGDTSLWLIPLSRICLFYIFLNTKSLEMYHRLLHALLLMGVLQAIIGISQTLIGAPVPSVLAEGLHHGPRNYFGYLLPFISKEVNFASGTFEHFNGLGSFLLLIYPISLGYWLERKKRKYFWAGAIIFCGIVCTFSRGALLAAMIATLFMIFSFYRNPRLKWGIIIGAVIFVLLFSTQIGTYMASSENATPRYLTWIYSLDYAFSNPTQLVFGYGLFHFRDVVLAGSLMTNLHNSYLQIFLEFGVVGLLLFGWATVRIIQLIRKHKTPLNYALIAIVMGFTLANLVDNSLFGYAGTLYFVLAGLFLSQVRMKDKKIVWGKEEQA